MKTTDYAGIDYSPLGSSVNRNPETGLRYGVISHNSLNHDACQDVYDNGTDLSYEDYIAEAKLGLRSALSDYFSAYKHGEAKESRLDQAVEEAFDAVSDGIGDNYQSDNARYRYEREGYVIQTCLDNDWFVSSSPYFTYAQFCSPCVPGACNLDSPLDHSSDLPQANKCYCLGHDWFDDGKAPYPVYSVATGEPFLPE